VLPLRERWSADGKVASHRMPFVGRAPSGAVSAILDSPRLITTSSQAIRMLISSFRGDVVCVVVLVAGVVAELSMKLRT